MTKRIVRTDALMVPIAQFSHALRVGGEIHVGATAGTDARRRLAGALPGLTDARAQAEQMYRNLRLALQLLGGDMADVVRLKSYVTDWRDLQGCEEAYGEHFAEPHPSRSTVASWGFPLPFAVVEAELTAVVGGAGALRYGVACGEDGPRAVSRLVAGLAATGLRARDVVKLTVTLADLHDHARFEQACAEAFEAPYPARTVSAAPLSQPGMRVEIEWVAFPGGGEPVEPRQLARREERASPGMLAGEQLFIGAQPGVDAQGRLAAGVQAQARAAWRRIEAILERAGMSRGDVVRTNNWLADWRSYQAFNQGYGEFVERPYPPRATIIGGMLEPFGEVQIEAQAHRDARNATVLEADTQEQSA